MKLKGKNESKYFMKMQIFIVVGLLSICSSKHAVFAFGYNDNEESQSNELTATTLDLVLTSTEANFIPGDELFPEDVVARNFYIENVGMLDFDSSVEYSFVSGDADLCSELELEVTHNFEDEFGVPQSVTAYTGKLDIFSLNLAGGDSDYLVTVGAIHHYGFEVTLPSDSDAAFSNKECVFKIIAKGWQEELSFGVGFYDIEGLESSISTDKWFNNELVITKYECPSGTTISEDQRPDSEGNATIPAECQAAEGYKFGYIYESSKSDLSGPYPGLLPDTTAFTLFGDKTDSNGVLSIEYLESVGRYDLTELDANDEPLDYDFVLGFLCYGDTGTYTNNYEITFVPENGITYCNVFDVEDLQYSAGDVLINEIMWAGSDEHELDQWIELYNDTGDTIDLTGWKLYSLGPSHHEIDLSGTIGSHDYYLITHYPTDDSKAAINDLISADLVNSSLNLSDNAEELSLRDPYGNEIDQSPTPSGGGDDWEAGEEGSPSDPLKKWRSMERNDDPATGWHSCTDPECDDDTYWDIDDGDNYGTPRAENHSEGDPSDEDKKQEDGNGEEEDPDEASDVGGFVDIGTTAPLKAIKIEETPNVLQCTPSDTDSCGYSTLPPKEPLILDGGVIKLPGEIYPEVVPITLPEEKPEVVVPDEPLVILPEGGIQE
jgi:hypothetical protein